LKVGDDLVGERLVFLPVFARQQHHAGAQPVPQRVHARPRPAFDGTGSRAAARVQPVGDELLCRRRPLRRAIWRGSGRIPRVPVRDGFPLAG
jgi:hypothetical protein